MSLQFPVRGNELGILWSHGQYKMNHKSNSFIRAMCVLSYISVSRLQTFSFILCIWSILYAVDYQIVSQVKVLILLWAGFTHGRKPSIGPVELSLSLITAMGQDVYAENAGIYCAWDRLSDMNFFFCTELKSVHLNFENHYLQIECSLTEMLDTKAVLDFGGG